MNHYYVRRKKIHSPVKLLCAEEWVSNVTYYGLDSVDCPQCLQILLALAEKRVNLLRENLFKAAYALQ